MWNIGRVSSTVHPSHPRLREFNDCLDLRAKEGSLLDAKKEIEALQTANSGYFTLNLYVYHGIDQCQSSMSRLKGTNPMQFGISHQLFQLGIRGPLLKKRDRTKAYHTRKSPLSLRSSQNHTCHHKGSSWGAMRPKREALSQ